MILAHCVHPPTRLHMRPQDTTPTPTIQQKHTPLLHIIRICMIYTILAHPERPVERNKTPVHVRRSDAASLGVVQLPRGVAHLKKKEITRQDNQPIEYSIRSNGVGGTETNAGQRASERAVNTSESVEIYVIHKYMLRSIMSYVQETERKTTRT